MEFCTEIWASHKKGQSKREEILQYLKNNPSASVQEISLAVGISTYQVRRHRSTLISQGWKNSLVMSGILILVSAYYGIDKSNSEHIESHIFNQEIEKHDSQSGNLYKRNLRTLHDQAKHRV